MVERTRLSTEQLRIFASIAETRGVSPAARALRLPKSSVSRTLSALESDLGVSLVVRTTRQITLTDTGTLLYRHALKVMADLEDAEAAIAGVAAAPKGQLRISTPLTLGQAYIAPALGRFFARYPDISLWMDLSGRAADLLAEGIDAAIRVGPMPDSTLIVRKLGSVQPIVCATKQVIAAYGEPLEPSDLMRLPILHVSLRSETTAFTFKRGKQNSQIAVKPKAALNDPSTVYAAMLGGAGFAIAPSFLARQDLSSKRVIRVLSDWTLPAQDITAVYPSQHSLSPRLRVFLDFVADLLKHSEIQS